MYDENKCLSCTATFTWQAHLEDHMDYCHHWPECETCTSTFRSWNACYQHMNSLDHWAVRFDCETCTRKFLSQHAANQHMNSVGHWAPKVPCETCTRMFHTQPAAEQHMKAQSHHQNYCKDCERHFFSENDLRIVRFPPFPSSIFDHEEATIQLLNDSVPIQHLNSKIHRGTNLPCPFCKANYTSASGFFHHLERGACPKAPSLNRERILKIVRERDPHGRITNKQIEWHKETRIEYAASDQAFNHNRNCWECYLCHKGFRARADLNRHLNSSTHKQNVYHCPNIRCGKQCVTLAALFNHLESESCAFMKFAKVQQHVDSVIQSGKLIAF